MTRELDGCVVRCDRCGLPVPAADESPIGQLLCACNLDLRTGLRAQPKGEAKR
jgi:hypothetical protein